jgi:hypothetical protein
MINVYDLLESLKSKSESFLRSFFQAYGSMRPQKALKTKFREDVQKSAKNIYLQEFRAIFQLSSPPLLEYPSRDAVIILQNKWWKGKSSSNRKWVSESANFVDFRWGANQNRELKAREIFESKHFLIFLRL